MSTFLITLKGICHFLPPQIRANTWLQKTGTRLLLQCGALDAVYSARYYQTMVEPYSRRSVGPIARSIENSFHPQSVIDVGCGSGALLVALRKLGIRNSLGLDCSEAALDIARARGLDTRKFDIATDQFLYSAFYDVAISMETAEHLPENSVDNYISLLCSLAPLIVFTAARPGQNGIGHLNEQSPEYWIEKFKSHNLQLDETLVSRWQTDWKAAGVSDFYTRNLMIFRR
ncbi:class I SAM-dependent methyltransferase [Tichowtungia aerotolerans]|uniref:Methyltransferase domain-containing protein n=1 Tax=Tichowtungia aerotolerans TaxID=2697043 RepID=A0A6P1M2Q3_9BACT|nr:class I SAM-dependent methyltransferase [Tichowtungia aerotolerans]QHI68880.1 methyltransferase domain-containing protein [Tichowtungia aerotolerans]